MPPWTRYLTLVALVFLPSWEDRKPSKPWLSTTEAFLSELRLMQGDKKSSNPNTYCVPGGIILRGGISRG